MHVYLQSSIMHYYFNHKGGKIHVPRSHYLQTLQTENKFEDNSIQLFNAVMRDVTTGCEGVCDEVPAIPKAGEWLVMWLSRKVINNQHKLQKISEVIWGKLNEHNDDTTI